MSRLGNKPIPVPGGVKIEIAGSNVTTTGPKGTLSWAVPSPIAVAVDGGEVTVSRPDDEKASRERHGLTRALIANMIEGVAQGYSIKLEVYGTGYSAKLSGKKLLLNCGYMGRGVGRVAQFEIPIPDGLQVTVETEAARGDNDPAKFTVTGIDKQAVGQFAAEIRKIRKPEPYKGKGIRYAGEQIRRKVGKQFAGGG